MERIIGYENAENAALNSNIRIISINGDDYNGVTIFTAKSQFSCSLMCIFGDYHRCVVDKVRFNDSTKEIFSHIYKNYTSIDNRVSSFKLCNNILDSYRNPIIDMHKEYIFHVFPFSISLYTSIFIKRYNYGLKFY